MSQDDFTPPTIEEISNLLPAYEILSFIAKGGMGAVYMATQKSLDRPVAIKILPRHFGEDAEFRASFEAEAKSMAKLNHPNLIGIYDFGQVDGLLYIIMEMVQGKSLYHSAYGKMIDPAETAKIVLAICRGLANAHKHGILHRDIKPANILLDPSASPKIGDFGLARPVGEHEKDSAFGTPGYTAPEVSHNPKAVDESTDIYAVGILLYELLTSKLPEHNYTPAATVTHCNPKFDQIIRKAIHPTPAMRYRSADAMADALEPLTKEKGSINPLLAGHSSKSSSSSAKTLLTAHSPQTGTPTSSATSPITSPATAAKAGSNIPFIRNILIIIALLATIVIAWEGLKKVEASRAAEKEHVAKLKEEEEAKKLKENIAVAKKKKRPTKTFEIPKPPPETPLETLSRLRSQLSRGIRAEMPKGSLTRAGRIRFHIDTPMTWNQAQAFCESHGGHLPVLPSNSDITWLTSQLTGDETIWLGAGSAGDNQWCWIDGTPWTLKIRTTSKAAYVAVDDTGILSPQPPSTRHPFFIEWNADGSTPASLKRQLERCAESLTSSAPLFPAGSISYDNRNYLLIEQSSTWISAYELAKLAGGTLAVPSTRDENEWMLSFIETSISKKDACWIGALRETNSTWKWVSGEPWKFANWAPEAPDEDQSTPAAATIILSHAWKDFPTDTRQSYFLIEWSSDGQGHETVQTTVKASGGLNAKRQKCATFLRGYQKTHDKNLTNNIKGYEQELRTYKRSLPQGLQKAYTPGIIQMRSRYVNNRIPDDLPRDNMPKKAAEILDSRLKKQSRLETDYLNKTEDLREKYRKSLFKTAAQLKEKGLTTNLREIQNELENTSSKGSDFIDYILNPS